MPPKFGPGMLHRVVRESVQKLVDVSLDQGAVFGMLRVGEGRVIVTASYEDKIKKARLPAMENENSVRDFFEILFEELRCEPFYEVFKQDLYDPEDEPLKNGLKRKHTNEVTLTFSHTSTNSTSATSMPTLTAANQPEANPGADNAALKIPRLSSIDTASFYNGKHKSTSKVSTAPHRPRGRPPGAKNKIPPEAKANKSPKTSTGPASPQISQNMNLTSSAYNPTSIPMSPTKKTGPIYQNAHRIHLEQEKAKALAAANAQMSSKQQPPENPNPVTPVKPVENLTQPPRLEPEELPKDPTLWTINNVISHLGQLDPSLCPHVEMFRAHEIDGNALLLLTSDMMMKYMGMKLGPALKICNIINMIQGKKHQPIPK